MGHTATAARFAIVPGLVRHRAQRLTWRLIVVEWWSSRSRMAMIESPTHNSCCLVSIVLRWGAEYRSGTHHWSRFDH